MKSFDSLGHLSNRIASIELLALMALAIALFSAMK